MKPPNVYLDELTDASKTYKVKVKVIEKRRPKTSPAKKLYQALVIEDDKGNRMRGALFSEQINMFEDAIKHNKVYEIANAPISLLKPEYKTDPTHLDYQMTFNKKTIVLPVDSDDSDAVIDYHPISTLPRATDYSEMFDIVDVVLFVDEHPRQVMTNKQRESNVREVMLVDHSTSQPLSISVWDELAEDDCTLLLPTPDKFKIVGFTALRVSNYKGFSMTTSGSTIIIHSPVGEKDEALKAWMANHQTALIKLQARLFYVKIHMPFDKPIKISTLRNKKAKSTLQDEKYWLIVTIPNAELHKVNAYMGCSNCGKRSSIPPGRTYICSTCSKPDCTTSPKITFNCDISDGTGTLPMTAFTSTTENLFKMTADIFHMKHSDNNEAFAAVQELLRLTPFKVHVAPATSLSISNILQWVVIDVVVDNVNADAAKAESVQQIAAATSIPAGSQNCQSVTDNLIAQSPHIDTVVSTNTTPVMILEQLDSTNVCTDIANNPETKPCEVAIPDQAQPQLRKNQAKETTTAALD